jgi:hypothetical protein
MRVSRSAMRRSWNRRVDPCCGEPCLHCAVVASQLLDELFESAVLGDGPCKGLVVPSGLQLADLADAGPLTNDLRAGALESFFVVERSLSPHGFLHVALREVQLAVPPTHGGEGRGNRGAGLRVVVDEGPVNRARRTTEVTVSLVLSRRRSVIASWTRCTAAWLRRRRAAIAASVFAPVAVWSLTRPLPSRRCRRCPRGRRRGRWRGTR